MLSHLETWEKEREECEALSAMASLRHAVHALITLSKHTIGKHSPNRGAVFFVMLPANTLQHNSS